jgi:ribonuclease HII
LAGPLTVAAVILDPACTIPGIDDSKRLTAQTRQRLAAEVRRHAVAWAVVHRSAACIDQVNVLEATREAMRSALLALRPVPACAVADALALPGLPLVVSRLTPMSATCASQRPRSSPRSCATLTWPDWRGTTPDTAGNGTGDVAPGSTSKR